MKTEFVKTETITVTPKSARELLDRNRKNRPIRPSHVETLRQSFERGEYVMTHQGIAFDDRGELIDGQHRLTAISLLESGSFTMLVTRGLNRDTVFPVVDATQAKRTTSDVLQLERGVGEVANFLAKIRQGRSTGITPSYVAPIADWISPEIHDLLAFCPSVAKTWSSAPVRAAAGLSMKFGDADYVKLIYRAMVLLDFDTMPQVSRVLFKAWQSGTVRAAGAYDIFARSLKMFDPKYANLQKVIINDANKVAASVRELIESEVYGVGKRKAATVSRAANGASSLNYRLAGL
jgi:hypothetical protein